ncbi:MAG: hypothetical protein ACLRZ7_07800 [Lachnospiraceae bacterium]
MAKEGRSSFKKEVEKIKTMNKKDIPWYIWEYYKFPIIAIVMTIVIVGMLIQGWVENSKPILISGAYINAPTSLGSDEDYISRTFFDYLDKDPKKNNMSIRTNLNLSTDPNTIDQMSMATTQIISAQIVSKDLDFISGSADVIDYYTQTQAIFFNLKEILPDDLYQSLEEHFYYAQDDKGNFLTDENGDKVPVALDITDSHIVEGMGFLTDKLYIGFVINSQRLDNIVEYVHYLYEYEPSSDIQ